MNLTEEQLKSIEDFAYRLILPSMIAINLGVDEFSFIEAIRTVGSPIRSAYYRGYLKQLVETREALIKAALADGVLTEKEKQILFYLAKLKVSKM